MTAHSLNNKTAVLEPQAGYDAAAPFYASWQWSRFWSANETPVLADWLNRMPDGPVLDAGCGGAKYLDLIQQQKHRYIGVDVSGSMLEYGRKKATDAGFKNAAFHAADMRQLPMPSNSVNSILCARALSHIKDPQEVFREFKRVLRSGGLIVISDIHPNHPYENTSIAAPQGAIAIATFKHPLDALADTAQASGGLELLGLREYHFSDLIWKPKNGFNKLRHSPDTPVFYTFALRKKD